MTGAAQSENPAKRLYPASSAVTAGPVGADASMRAVAQAGIRSGKSRREIAVDLYGEDRVAADWDLNGWMRAKVRRLVRHARAASSVGSGGADAGTP